jgi:hypothetical protein
MDGTIWSEHLLSELMNRRAETRSLIEPLLTLPEVGALLKLEGDVERTLKRLLKEHGVSVQKLGREFRLTVQQYQQLLAATKSCPPNSRNAAASTKSRVRSVSANKASGLERLRAAAMRRPPR